MTTDNLHDFASGVWSLRYALLFVAFLVATALALVWRHERDDARRHNHEVEEYLTDAWKRIDELQVERDGAATTVEVDLTIDDPIFSEGYVYDRLPSWVPADVPGAPGGAR